MNDDTLPELPPGYTVRKEPMVGVVFLNANGRIVEYHPVDNESIRRLVWHMYPRTKDLPALVFHA